MKRKPFNYLKPGPFLYLLLSVVFLVSCSKTGEGFSIEEWGSLMVNAMNRGQLFVVILIGSVIGSQFGR